ncbi:MAG: hypothetical protein Q8T04_19400, partial [Bacteroidota bacterium]|nr:hypothetical protein [Bacteroidota bacterium]
MTVAELAQKLNVTVPEIFEHYKRSSEDIPQDENFILSTELIRIVIPSFQPDDHPNQIEDDQIGKRKRVTTSHNDLSSKFEERRKTHIEILDKLELYFNWNETTLLKEFKKHNLISSFIFKGEYEKAPNRDFGFFKNITHQDGTFLTYPVSNDTVDKIYIATGQLTNGKRYSFEATIARKNERIKITNPFLLQAKSDNIQEIKDLNAITQVLESKKAELQKIANYLEKAEEHFENKKEEIEEKVSKVFQEKQNKANEIIETYQETINQKFKEIKSKEKELTTLNKTFEALNNQLHKM